MLEKILKQEAVTFTNRSNFGFTNVDNTHTYFHDNEIKHDFDCRHHGSGGEYLRCAEEIDYKARYRRYCKECADEHYILCKLAQ